MARQLGVCAEMLWLDKPLEWRISRLTEMGFGVGIGIGLTRVCPIF